MSKNSRTTNPAATAAASAALSALPAPSPIIPHFFHASDQSWQPLVPASNGTPELNEKEQNRSKSANKLLREYLLGSLQMQHLIVLAGSGTSLGPAVGGPSMWDLWNGCVNNDSVSTGATTTRKTEAQRVIEDVKYEQAVASDQNKENIEVLLSQCEAYLQFNSGATHVAAFVKASKEAILKKCSQFIDLDVKPNQLQAHRTFLHRLSRRRVRDSRLKLFTTNYDMCFEEAAARQGLIAIDGFSFSQPRYFDPRFFNYDIIRRTPTTGEFGTPLEGVFQLLKLHGSVNWRRSGGVISVESEPNGDDACLVYPAKGKYQQSYIQPHLELISQYSASLREPNTCLVVVGFGFNDDHLSEPILAAVRTNPHFRMIVVSSAAMACFEGSDTAKCNRYWSAWSEVAKNGGDILLINAKFDQFVDLIPDLKSLTPAEHLAKSVAAVARGS